MVHTKISQGNFFQYGLGRLPARARAGGLRPYFQIHSSIARLCISGGRLAAESGPAAPDCCSCRKLHCPLSHHDATITLTVTAGVRCFR